MQLSCISSRKLAHRSGVPKNDREVMKFPPPKTGTFRAV